MKHLLWLAMAVCLGRNVTAQTTAKPLLDPAQFHTVRGDMANSYLTFQGKRRGRVAFLGGSITENPGWCAKVCAWLQERFPGTAFDFINAGIGSTGSTPGAFRLDHDVLGKGPVDLLFEEAAVNDHYNGFGDTANLRAMEGIVRHARIVNPMMDIVLMYFVDVDKIADYHRGVIPRVIQVHDSVAAYYHLSSIDLAKEVTARIDAGEFTWAGDFKDAHPSPFGQEVYVRSICKFLSDRWAHVDSTASLKPFVLPPPMDVFSYVKGGYVDIQRAFVGDGWYFDDDWSPKDGTGTRKGYVHVPMLISDAPGAALSFAFSGTAVGICVAAGLDAGMIDYSVDGKPFRRQDLFNPGASRLLHLPWYFVLASELAPGKHVLTIRVAGEKSDASIGHACRIVHFLVNGDPALQIDPMAVALGQPWGKTFWIQRRRGVYSMGDTVSQYDRDKDMKDLCFDISNNMVLANMSAGGALKNISMYRDAYFANCGPPVSPPDGSSGGSSGGWPGVWAAKDNCSFGPYCFSLLLDGHRYNLDTVGWDFKTGLLDNLFPITELSMPGGNKASLIAYAPLSPRIRGLIYGLLLENRSGGPLRGVVYLPRLFAGDRQQIKTSWALFDPFDFEVALGNDALHHDSVVFDLKPGETLWVPAVFTSLGDNALSEIKARGTLACLSNTHGYFRKMLGRLNVPGNTYLAEFYERQVMEAFGSIAMTAAGKVAGSSWGTYPTTRQIWMKDCYYISLPFMHLEPELARKLIDWFRVFGVRPAGNTQPGGVNHSVGISVASILLATQYYRSTGDKGFFIRDPSIRMGWDSLLRQLVASRQDTSVWLFPSRFISDGPIAADFHTGSNVCAWAALNGFAQLLREVYHDPSSAAWYAALAQKVHAAILRFCTIEGPYGRQFIEGTYVDGRQPPMISDGEESDITLMPFYGFLPYDDSTYLHYMAFSLSEHNAIYEPALHAITWFGVPSTAPGYLKGLCAGYSFRDLFGEHGYYTEVHRITDADGSIWWWSYGWASEMLTGSARAKNPPAYGKVVRGVPGKSGWFSGVYSALFVDRFIGLSASGDRIRLAPMSVVGDFSFSGVPLGDQRFSVAYSRRNGRTSLAFDNPNQRVAHLDVLLPGGEGAVRRVLVNGQRVRSFQVQTYLGSRVLVLHTDVAPNVNLTIDVIQL